MLRKSLLSAQALLCSAYLIAQCNLPFPPGDVCQDAPYFCYDLLDGYCSTTQFGSLIFPNPFCGTVENDHWFKFQAGSSSLTLQLTPSNCQGTFNGTGIQGEIYQTDDCFNFISVSNCLSTGLIQDRT